MLLAISQGIDAASKIMGEVGLSRPQFYRVMDRLKSESCVEVHKVGFPAVTTYLLTPIGLTKIPYSLISTRGITTTSCLLEGAIASGATTQDETIRKLGGVERVPYEDLKRRLEGVVRRQIKVSVLAQEILSTEPFHSGRAVGFLDSLIPHMGQGMLRCGYCNDSIIWDSKMYGTVCRWGCRQERDWPAGYR